jgi:co-chaperonin GroES (HSP10)
VSTPVTWDEVEQTLKKKDASRLVFEATDVLARVEKWGDLFAPVQTLKQKLPQLARLVAESKQEAKKEGERVAVGEGQLGRASRAAAKKARKAANAKTSGKVKSAADKRRKI